MPDERILHHLAGVATSTRLGRSPTRRRLRRWLPSQAARRGRGRGAAAEGGVRPVVLHGHSRQTARGRRGGWPPRRGLRPARPSAPRTSRRDARPRRLLRGCRSARPCSARVAWLVELDDADGDRAAVTRRGCALASDAPRGLLAPRPRGPPRSTAAAAGSRCRALGAATGSGRSPPRSPGGAPRCPSGARRRRRRLRPLASPTSSGSSRPRSTTATAPLAACRAQARAGVGALAQRCAARAPAGTTSCCPAAQLDQLRGARSPRVRHRATVLERLGLRRPRARAGSAPPRCSPGRAAPARRWPPR